MSETIPYDEPLYQTVLTFATDWHGDHDRRCITPRGYGIGFGAKSLVARIRGGGALELKGGERYLRGLEEAGVGGWKGAQGPGLNGVVDYAMGKGSGSSDEPL